MSQPIHRNALHEGSALLWYRIERILGQGGFGITYLAMDSNLDQQVAIKEYLPMELAVREGDQSVHPVSQGHEEDFQWGLERFISEARTLARFDHPNIARVLSVFEANNTAYLVMRYEQGNSLQELLPRRGTLEEAALMDIVLPITSGLATVHEQGFIHRDIKPANIFIRSDGSPVLIDFGSAREALNRSTRTLTSLVSPGYAPFEQYYSKSDRQGPWTDVYALGATLYRASIGAAPADAVDRSEGIINQQMDPYISAVEAGRGRYSQRFLAAIDQALIFKDTDRPQTLADWIELFEVPQVDHDAITALATWVNVEPATADQERDQGRDQEQDQEHNSRENESPTAVTELSDPAAECTQTEAAATTVSDTNTQLTDMQLLIGPRQAYYSDYFQKFDSSEKVFPVSWQWPACLMSFAWLNYRKLYFWAWLGYPLATVACTVLLLIPISIVFFGGGEVPKQISAVLLIASAFILPAMCANTLYYRRLKKLVVKVDSLELEPPQRRAWLQRRGGVSIISGIFGAVFGIIIALGLTDNARKAKDLSNQESSGQTTKEPDTSASKVENINPEDLIAAAREDIQNLRLSTPAGRNAQEKLQQLREGYPEHPQVSVLQAEIIDQYRTLGIAAARKGDFEQATTYLRRAKEIDPTNPQIAKAEKRLRVLDLMSKGKQAAKDKDLTSAVEYVRQALELDPDNPDIKKNSKRLKQIIKRAKESKN